MTAQIICMYVRAMAFIVWRVTQAAVIIPATIVGLLVAVMALVGQRPVERGLESVFHYAEVNIRPARPGYVLVVDCVSHAETSGLTKPPVLCDSTSPKEIGIPDAIASAEEVLQRLYLVLVVISFTALLMTVPDRRKLLGLCPVMPGNEGEEES